MARIYKPVMRVRKECACGCGRIFIGRRDKRFVNDTHRVRAFKRKLRMIKAELNAG